MRDLPSKGAIFRAWKSWLDENCIDWGEPCCWACGEFWWGRYDRSVELESDLDKVWENAPLERCHIVPRALGGTDDPENLFLLCTACHDHAPNTTSREGFLQWVKSQEEAWFRRRTCDIEELVSELKTLGFSDLREVMGLMKSSEFDDWCDKNTSLHWARTGKQGPRCTPSTLATALWEFRKQRDQKKPQGDD